MLVNFGARGERDAGTLQDRGPDDRASHALQVLCRARFGVGRNVTQEANQVARAVVLLFLFRHHLVFGTSGPLGQRSQAPIV